MEDHEPANRSSMNNIMNSPEKNMRANKGNYQDNAEYDVGCCMKPCCGSVRRLINFIGASAALVNLSLDISYAIKTPYIMKMIFVLTCFFILFRIIVTLIAG
jgi:hypothetical protein